MSWLLAIVGLPPWLRPVLIAGVIVGALAGAYLKGHHDAAKACEAASLRAEIAILRRDLEVAKTAEAEAERSQAELDRMNKTMAEEIAAYETELASRPAGACALTPDDVKRLRQLGSGRHS